MNEIIEKIRSETGKEISGIQKKYASLESEITAQAEQEAKEKVSGIREKSEKRAELEKTRIVSAANLEARKKKAELIDSILESWISEARKNISELRKEKSYAARLKEIVKTAVEEIPAEKVTVLVSNADLSKAKTVKVKGKKISVKASSELKTGAIIRSDNAEVEINASFVSSLENRKAEIKKELLKNLGV